MGQETIDAAEWAPASARSGARREVWAVSFKDAARIARAKREKHEGEAESAEHAIGTCSLSPTTVAFEQRMRPSYAEAEHHRRRCRAGAEKAATRREVPANIGRFLNSVSAAREVCEFSRLLCLPAPGGAAIVAGGATAEAWQAAERDAMRSTASSPTPGPLSHLDTLPQLPSLAAHFPELTAPPQAEKGKFGLTSDALADVRTATPGSFYEDVTRPSSRASTAFDNVDGGRPGSRACMAFDSSDGGRPGSRLSAVDSNVCVPSGRPASRVSELEAPAEVLESVPAAPSGLEHSHPVAESELPPLHEAAGDLSAQGGASFLSVLEGIARRSPKNNGRPILPFRTACSFANECKVKESFLRFKEHADKQNRVHETERVRLTDMNIAWLNTKFAMECATEFEFETGYPVILLTILDAIYRGKVPWHRVHWRFQYKQAGDKNYQLLDQMWRDVNMDKVRGFRVTHTALRIETMREASIREKLNFLKLLRDWFDSRIYYAPAYDPIHRRAEYVEESRRKGCVSEFPAWIPYDPRAARGTAEAKHMPLETNSIAAYNKMPEFKRLGHFLASAEYQHM